MAKLSFFIVGEIQNEVAKLPSSFYGIHLARSKRWR